MIHPQVCDICLAGPKHPDYRKHVLGAREAWYMGASPDAYCPAWEAFEVFQTAKPDEIS